MMDYADLDMMARGGSLALLLLWSWVLIRDHWQALPARIAVLMNLAIIAHIIATMPILAGNDIPLDWLLEIASGLVPAFFWIFARTWFNDETRVGWGSWMLIALSAAVVVVIMVNFDAKPPLFYAAAATMRIMMFSFAFAGLWAAWRGRDADLIEARRQLRKRLIGAVGAYVILVNVVEILVHNNLAQPFWRSLIEAGIALLTFAFCATMFGIRQADMFGAAQQAETVTNRPPLDDPLANRLLAFMEHHKPHRDETLTIAALASQLGEQEYRLRRLINGRLGYRNFATFLNGYRLAEVKAALTDPSQRDVPILTIALDAGFGSLGPFNRAFREAEGMTPSAYRAAST
jgi:AraC-like DNA-binding protein